MNGREWVKETCYTKCFVCSSRVERLYIRASPFTVRHSGGKTEQQLNEQT